MDKWKELDDIKTPEDWKQISYRPKRRVHSLSLVLVSVIVCFSLITVSAFHSDLSRWITDHFPQNEVHVVKDASLKDLKWIDPPFGYIKKKNKIVSIYLIKNQKLKLQKPKEFKGTYKKPFSFKYVRYHNDIRMYDFKGPIDYGIDTIFGQTVYLCTNKNELISLNIKTGHIELLAHNAINPIISPHGKYILINKNKSYWTIYDIKNHTERKVKDIAGYALSNELSFYDDEHIITYGDSYMVGDTAMCDTIVIESTSLNIVKRWHAITENASAIEINQRTIKNHMTNQTCTVEGEGPLNRIGFTDHYILFEDEENNYYLYNIKDNQYVSLSIPEKLRNTSVHIYEYEDESELMIYTDQESYFVNLKTLFH